jgi:LysM repeat protein
MERKDSPQNVIESYRKRQRLAPFLIGALVVLLIVVGIIFLVIWLTGSGGPALSFLNTDTPTPTSTSTPTPVTPTITPSITPTETLTPTVTETPTPSGPFEYTVKEDDTCWGIHEDFDVDLEVLLAINNLGNDCAIKPGDVILIPAPGQELPTATPLPTGLASGTKIEYTVQLGDSLETIASKFSTTVDQILKDNKIDDKNAILAGDVLIIRINIVTPTKTLAPTSTSAATTTLTATLTPVP